MTLLRQLKRFAGWDGDATYLWPRWILLRAVGLVYVLIFAGIIAESSALIGPHGLAPIADLLGGMHRAFPGSARPFLLAPSLFWIGSGAGMIAVLEWAGLAAAVALVLNLWPRMALFACWLIFLSFVSAWGIFSPAQLDDLMLEVALLCIPFAPAGYRPGLGAASPPRPLAVFMMRWLLFRVMFGDGLVKLIAGDRHWRDFTAMDVMHEVAPFPTVLGYLDHQLPHAWHACETAFTFVAELAAPLLAVFAGRRGRWFAFWVWLAFQAGIELTTNFGWLNVAAVALGFVLLDDQMLKSAGRRFKTRQAVASTPDAVQTSEVEAAARRFRGGPARAASACQTWSLRAALSFHFYLTLCAFFVFVRIDRGLPLADVSRAITGPVDLFWNFHSANEYNLYATVGSGRYGVEFAGSNDGGRTWRAYDYRYISQDVDRICPFIAPWFPRFETTIQNLDFSANKAWLYRTVAAELMAGNRDVIALFARNPFAGSAPLAVRIRYYRLWFTDRETHRRTGRYWRKEYEPDLLPMMYVDASGDIVSAEAPAAGRP